MLDSDIDPFQSAKNRSRVADTSAKNGLFDHDYRQPNAETKPGQDARPIDPAQELSDLQIDADQFTADSRATIDPLRHEVDAAGDLNTDEQHELEAADRELASTRGWFGSLIDGIKAKLGRTPSQETAENDPDPDKPAAAAELKTADAASSEAVSTIKRPEGFTDELESWHKEVHVESKKQRVDDLKSEKDILLKELRLKEHAIGDTEPKGMKEKIARKFQTAKVEDVLERTDIIELKEKIAALTKEIEAVEQEQFDPTSIIKAFEEGNRIENAKKAADEQTRAEMEKNISLETAILSRLNNIAEQVHTIAADSDSDPDGVKLEQLLTKYENLEKKLKNIQAKIDPSARMETATSVDVEEDDDDVEVDHQTYEKAKQALTDVQMTTSQALMLKLNLLEEDAEAILTKMEKEKLVGPENGNNIREVYIKSEAQPDSATKVNNKKESGVEEEISEKIIDSEIRIADRLYIDSRTQQLMTSADRTNNANLRTNHLGELLVFAGDPNSTEPVLALKNTQIASFGIRQEDINNLLHTYKTRVEEAA